MTKQKLRRLMAALVLMIGAAYFVVSSPGYYESPIFVAEAADEDSSLLATTVLAQLEIKGRAPRTGYSRDQFGNGWGNINGCDARNVILQRDLVDTVLDGCIVISGTLHDPYTGQTILFQRGPDTSGAVQIDHVVALSDAWQKGAQSWPRAKRISFHNDPLNLLAVDGPANQAKSDSDAASWLPPNRAFRCEMVARQIGVKFRYSLWMTTAERDASARVLESCPGQRVLPSALVLWRESD